MQSKPHERIIEIADARLIPMMEKIKALVEERKECAEKIKKFIKANKEDEDADEGLDSLERFVEIEEEMKQALLLTVNN